MKKFRGQTTLELLQDTYYNMTFKMNKAANLSSEIKPGTVVYYLGEEISTDFDKDDQITQLKEKQNYLDQLFKSTMWFTYRRVFPVLENELTNQDYISDTGWGCMIRCGQMIFAQGLRRHLNKQLGLSIDQYIDIILAFADDDQPNLVSPQKHGYLSLKNSEINQENSDKTCDSIDARKLNEILKKQSEELQLKENIINSPYSIQKIAQKAKEEFKDSQQPGQWYNPNRICYILNLLHKDQQLKGTENLEICIMNTDAPVAYEILLQKFCGKKTKLFCQCKQQQLQEQINKANQNNFIDNLSQQDEFQMAPIQILTEKNHTNSIQQQQQNQQSQQKSNNMSSIIEFIQISNQNCPNNLELPNTVFGNQGNTSNQQNQSIVCIQPENSIANNDTKKESNQNCNKVENNLNDEFSNKNSNNNNLNQSKQMIKHKKHKESIDGQFEILDEKVYYQDQTIQDNQNNNNNNNQNSNQQQKKKSNKSSRKSSACADIEIIDQQLEQVKFDQSSCTYCPKCHKSDKSVIVFIGCKIGLNNPEQKYLDIINELLQIKYNLGMIGGRPQKALYFPGILGNKYIFLDPHKVQQFTSMNNIQKNEQLETHFCNELFTVQQDKIDSCLTLGFYLKNLDELDDFFTHLKNLNKKFSPNNFIWVEDALPNYINTGEDNLIDCNYDQYEIPKQPQVEELPKNDGQEQNFDFYKISQIGSSNKCNQNNSRIDNEEQCYNTEQYYQPQKINPNFEQDEQTMYQSQQSAENHVQILEIDSD